MNHLIAIAIVLSAFIIYKNRNVVLLTLFFALVGVVSSVGLIISAICALIQRPFQKKVKHDMVRLCRKEYEFIRKSIHLCIASGPLLLIEIRMSAFKAYSENILDYSQHFRYCSDLETRFAEKEKEIIEMELQIDSMQMAV